MDSKNIGISAESFVAVTEENTALALGSGDLKVFATPAMIALMERAAVKCIEKYIDISETSVGSSINVAHLKPSAIGDGITAFATLTNIEGRKLTFSVEALDNKKEIIGKGTHERYIVDREKFLEKLLTKNK